MFFVGATGQLLTLILTVCLPFVFLFSAQPKTELLNDSLRIKTHEIKQQVSTIENNFIDIHFETVEIFSESPPDLEESIFKKFPGDQFKIKWKSLYLISSGNKAPPSSFYSAC